MKPNLQYVAQENCILKVDWESQMNLRGCTWHATCAVCILAFKSQTTCVIHCYCIRREIEMLIFWVTVYIRENVYCQLTGDPLNGVHLHKAVASGDITVLRRVLNTRYEFAENFWIITFFHLLVIKVLVSQKVTVLCLACFWQVFVASRLPCSFSSITVFCHYWVLASEGWWEAWQPSLKVTRSY